MWSFITAHAPALTVIVTAVTLIVWTVYGQIMSANQRRQQKPRLFIKQANGHGPDSVCLISNMGKESVYLRAVFIDLHDAEGACHTGAVEKQWQAQPSGAGAEAIGQGPIAPSQQLDLGPFEWLLAEAARKAGMIEAEEDLDLAHAIDAFTVTAIVTAGPYEQIVGAEHRFSIEPTGPSIRPDAHGTRLRASRRDARALERYLRAMTEADRRTQTTGHS